jgi:hypothetical protein
MKARNACTCGARQQITNGPEVVGREGCQFCLAGACYVRAGYRAAGALSAAPNDRKATLLLALSGLTESAFTALLSDAPAERKEIIVSVARKLLGVSA